MAASTTLGITKLSVAAASTTNPIAIGDNDARIPIVGQKNALVGTAGLPSTSNPYVSSDDIATTTLNSRIPRYSSSGQLTGSSTPVASTDLSSKGYVDTQTLAVTPKFASGFATFTANGSSTITTGFTIKQIVFSAVSSAGGEVGGSWSHGVWTASSTATTFASTSKEYGTTFNSNGSVYALQNNT